VRSVRGRVTLGWLLNESKADLADVSTNVGCPHYAPALRAAQYALYHTQYFPVQKALSYSHLVGKVGFSSRFAT
jgi:hypothetical protein